MGNVVQYGLDPFYQRLMKFTQSVYRDFDEDLVWYASCVIYNIIYSPHRIKCKTILFPLDGCKWTAVFTLYEDACSCL